MPLAAITPVLNDLLHKKGGSRTSSQQNYPQQQTSNSNDSPSSNDYTRKESILGQSISITNPLTSSSIDDVSN
jgi:hypothetical protein